MGGDGFLCLSEFKAILDEEDILNWLGSMGLDVDDVDVIWSLCDNGDDHLSAVELTDGVAKLMGDAKSIDLRKLAYDFHVFRRMLLGPHDLDRKTSSGNYLLEQGRT